MQPGGLAVFSPVRALPWHYYWSDMLDEAPRNAKVAADPNEPRKPVPATTLKLNNNVLPQINGLDAVLVRCGHIIAS